MTQDDVIAELNSLVDDFVLTQNDIYDILSKVKVCSDLLIQQGIVDKTKLQNAVLKERQILIDKYGFPEYNVPLPNHEIPVSHWAQ